MEHKKQKGMFFFHMSRKSIGQPDNLSHSEPSLGTSSATDGLCDLGQVTPVLCASISFSVKCQGMQSQARSISQCMGLDTR